MPERGPCRWEMWSGFGRRHRAHREPNTLGNEPTDCPGTTNLIMYLTTVAHMDTYEAILTKLDVRDFADKGVDAKIKTKILQAARFTGSSMNSQHWRFILVQDKKNLATLARDSSTGDWVKNADFAVIINIDPKVPGSNVDGGRVLQDMELAAWNFGVVSRLFTGFKEPELRRDFGIPPELKPAAVLGFGYPVKAIKGKKNRKPLEELVSLEKYGNPYHPTQ